MIKIVFGVSVLFINHLPLTFVHPYKVLGGKTNFRIYEMCNDKTGNSFLEMKFALMAKSFVIPTKLKGGLMSSSVCSRDLVL